jgi:SAM-dependent methyltransferase
VAILRSKDLVPPMGPTRFLAIDEEGYFLLDGLRVSDVATGHSWMSRIRIDPAGRSYLADNLPDHPLLPGESPGRILIEAFDQPLVALDVTVSRTNPKNQSGSEIRARFPYGFETVIQADSLRSDEWDRFYARTREGVPLVFGRAAQSRLFQTASEYDDDSITFGDGNDAIKFAVQPLFEELEVASEPDWWNEIYQKGDMRWDNGGAHPLLDFLIPALKLTRCRVLVLGCGTGHDAAWWEKRGHIVTAVDFSHEAIERARSIHGERESMRWIEADVLNLPSGDSRFAPGNFDIIFENTLFCAIPPGERETLVRNWYRLLSRRGRLVGLVPVMDKLAGPPFGTSEWEMRKRLLEPTSYLKSSAQAPAQASARRARFVSLLWNREKNSIEKWLGKELYFVVEKADFLTE